MHFRLGGRVDLGPTATRAAMWISGKAFLFFVFSFC